MLLVSLAVLAAVAGLLQVVWHGAIFAGRASFPLDLEWMEGGTLIHAQRIARGQPIYVPPTVDFIPFLYTPLYPALLALLSKIAPLGYLLGRIVSLLAFAGALGLTVFAAAREGFARRGPARAAATMVGLAGAGAVAGSFELTGAFYDLVRADSLLLFLEALTLVLAMVGTSLRSAALAGLVMGLAFFTKQTAPVVGIGIGLGLLVAHWRRGLVYGVVAGLVMGLGLLYLTKSSDGWFWTYVYKLHQSHPFRYDTLTLTPKVLWRHEHATLMVLLLSTGGLALAGKLRRTDAIVWGAALAGISAGVIGFATMWAWQNAYIPAVYFSAFAAAVLTARLVVYALVNRKPRTAAVAAICVLSLAYQDFQLRKPQARTWVPQPSDHQAAVRFLETIRSLPGEGFIPFHPYYGVLAGKRPFVHRMGVMDVAGTLGFPISLREALESRRFSFVILDWKANPGEFPFLDQRYRLAHTFRDGHDAVRMFSGAETSPRYLLVPVTSPPAR